MNSPDYPLWVDEMSNYAIPQYSIIELNATGKMLAKLEDGTPEEYAHAIGVIDNWRASHAYPLLIFYQTLKHRACKIHRSALIAQRTKRLISIIEKLRREENMKLSQMQDIGGCRAVLGTLEQVRKLEQVYLSSRWEHEELNHKDYIQYPKPSGYRSIHLKYKYKGIGEKSNYNRLKIEIQLRTNLQHTWATAVETAGTFTKQALKSNFGNESWLRFFSLMSSVFAIRENCPIVPGTSISIEELKAEIREINKSHQIVNNFAGTTAVLAHVRKLKNAVYFLVTLDPDKLTVEVKTFKKNESQIANKAYTDLEKQFLGSRVNVVLVSSTSVKALERAYPNYFLDARSFLQEVLSICNAV
jgi:Region found in RelA / SpoT proteins